MADKLKVALKVSEPRTGVLGSHSTVEVMDFRGETDLTLAELKDVLAFVVTGVRSDSVKVLVDETELYTDPYGGLDVTSFDTAYDLTKSTLTPAVVSDYEPTELTFTPAVVPKIKRKSPTPHKKAVCENCGRSYKAVTGRQRFCHKEDCAEVTASLATMMAEYADALIPPELKKRKSSKHTTPRIPKVCAHCGDKFKAHTHKQYVCYKLECQAWRKARNRKTQNARARGQKIPLSRTASIPSLPAICESCGDAFMAFSKYQRVCRKPECKAWRHSSTPKRHYKPRAKSVKAENVIRTVWQPKVTVVAGQGVVSGAV
jgi:hypothetical protein